MGGVGSKHLTKQILLQGLPGSGKTFFLKKFIDIRKKESDLVKIDGTIGFNYVQVEYNKIYKFDVWDLGGDDLTTYYLPTFYRNLSFDFVLFFIDVFDRECHYEALQQLLVILNEEELKTAAFCIVFNVKIDDSMKLKMTDSIMKEAVSTAEEIISYIKGSPVHNFDNRVSYIVLDLSKIKEGENKTIELMKKLLSI